MGREGEGRKTWKVRGGREGEVIPALDPPPGSMVAKIVSTAQINNNFLLLGVAVVR